MKKIFFEVNNNLNLPIKFDLRRNNYNHKSPLNIVIHGFKAFRNWGFIPYLCDKLAENSGPTINLDFSLNGIENEEKMLYNPDLFRKNTVSQQLEDINILLDYIKSDEFLYNIEDVWNGEINLIGHSLGGAVSIVTAGERDDISRIVLWGTISKTDRNTERQKKEWRETGYIEFKESHSGQLLYLNVEYLNDKELNKDRIDLRRIISELEIPICIIHGKLDFTVRLNEAEILENLSKKSSKLESLYIEKSNHTFGVSHPFTKTNDGLELAIEKTIDFVKI